MTFFDWLLSPYNHNFQFFYFCVWHEFAWTIFISECCYFRIGAFYYFFFCALEVYLLIFGGIYWIRPIFWIPHGWMMDQNFKNIKFKESIEQWLCFTKQLNSCLPILSRSFMTRTLYKMDFMGYSRRTIGLHCCCCYCRLLRNKYT